MSASVSLRASSARLRRSVSLRAPYGRVWCDVCDVCGVCDVCDVWGVGHTVCVVTPLADGHSVQGVGCGTHRLCGLAASTWSLRAREWIGGQRPDKGRVVCAGGGSVGGGGGGGEGSSHQAANARLGHARHLFWPFSGPFWDVALMKAGSVP
eukprot:360883-Chlamydomonas_euryale.AAC.5